MIHDLSGYQLHSLLIDHLYTHSFFTRALLIRLLLIKSFPQKSQSFHGDLFNCVMITYNMMEAIIVMSTSKVEGIHITTNECQSLICNETCPVSIEKY